MRRGAHRAVPPGLDVETMWVFISAMAGRDHGDTEVLYIQLPKQLEDAATSITRQGAQKLENKIHGDNNQTELVLTAVCPVA